MSEGLPEPLGHEVGVADIANLCNIFGGHCINV